MKTSPEDIKSTIKEAGASWYTPGFGLGTNRDIEVYGPKAAVLRAIFALGLGFDTGRTDLLGQDGQSARLYDEEGHDVGQYCCGTDRAGATIAYGYLPADKRPW